MSSQPLSAKSGYGCVLFMDRKITALKAQKRNQNRVSVFLDGEFAFGLARIVAAWLHVGQLLNEEQINKLLSQDTEEVAYLKALRYLSYRPRSEAEVRQKMISSGYTDTVIETVITRLRDHMFIQDPQFAQMWVENRSTFRPRSQRVLKMELRQKGIHDDTIEAALADVDDDDLAYQAAARRAQKYAGLEWQDFREKLSGFLARRGFSYGTIAPVVRQVWAELKSVESTNSVMGNESEYD
jgi:regulatory protein